MVRKRIKGNTQGGKLRKMSRLTAENLQRGERGAIAGNDLKKGMRRGKKKEIPTKSENVQTRPEKKKIEANRGGVG